MNLSVLTPELQRALDRVPAKRKQQATELRFRIGAPAKLSFPWGEELLCGSAGPILVTDRLLRELLDRATGFSPYTLRGEEAGLFLPLEGGCRLGLCGEAVVQNGKITGIRHISSLVIRLAREVKGIAQKTSERLTERGYVESVLIVSPPGFGKTTFLRDLIRGVSSLGYRVSVADERREIAAAKDGVPQLDVGPCTDVLTGCPKGEALGLLLRVMNPQVLAVDELAGEQEMKLVREAAHWGVAVFATAHGRDMSDLVRRPGCRPLLEEGTFRWCVTLGSDYSIRMERLGGYAEDGGGGPGDAGVADVRLGRPSGSLRKAAAHAADSSGSGADAGGDGVKHAQCRRAV